MKVHLRLNGAGVEIDARPDAFLLEVLRDQGLTGAKEGCGVGVCGACTVLVDGAPVSSCLLLVGQCDGCAVVTAEGVGQLAPHIAAAFSDHEGLQCGICTPGQVVSAYALLRKNPHPGDAEIRSYMAGNLCRCTGYASIRRSIEAAANG
ncbi:MAG TPA: (2Fe-2S)-binding protein [Bacillota bacterium]|nr:(2Fe-2S)-binding protein [Bacillota bacterium]